MPIAYVTHFTSGTVSVIDTKTHSVIATIQVENAPLSVTITPDGKLAYIANFW
ncbi:YncE family protein [Bacillus sp. SCS-151]|uniref:YncE family protein n=1 Tax=Nanhaiella sioensis TaxID=3115293 RepID=UPI00397993B3